MKNPDEGHRGRLLERFEKNGVTGLHDYEIVELLLSFVILRRDVKPIAKQLLGRYRTIGAALNAPASELMKIDGIGKRAAQLLAFFRDAAAYCLREKFENQSVIAKRSDVEAYLRFQFGMKRDEYVAVLYLDTGNRCIGTEVVAEGTVNQCAVYPRSIVERGLSRGAAAMILAHNHPGGAAAASKADWNITSRLHAIGKQLDMPLLDHLIISGDTVVSLRDFPQWPGG